MIPILTSQSCLHLMMSELIANAIRFESSTFCLEAHENRIRIHLAYAQTYRAWVFTTSCILVIIQIGVQPSLSNSLSHVRFFLFFCNICLTYTYQDSFMIALINVRHALSCFVP